MSILEYSKKYETEKHYNGDQDDPNYYSEAYEIEMDNAAENDEQGAMDYQDEDSDSHDPLSNYVTAELSDGDNDEGDDGETDLNQEDDNEIDETVTPPPDSMTVEELAHFNFANEDDDEIQDENEEDAYIEDDVNDDTNMNDQDEGDIIVPSIQITADHHN